MSVHLVPMPAASLAGWIEAGHLHYIESRMRSGESLEVATEKAERSRAENFPGGRPLETHRVFDVVADTTVVGCLWLGPLPAGTTDWWVFDIEIDEPHRRRGYARRALELGEAAVRELGATSLGLNVFGYNAGAKELYDSLGFEVTATQMKKVW
jgi:ribosomal protein S18 acetylase RimI-like enzyme